MNNKKSISEIKKLESFISFRNRKAISEVVVTVLLILVSIIAVIVAWQFIGRMIRGTDIDTSGITVDLKITSAVINKEIVNVSISRNVGVGNISGLALKFDGDGKSYTSYVNISIQELETIRIPVSLYDKIDYLEKVSVAPIITNNKGKNVVGVVVDVYNIKGIISAYGYAT